MLELFKLAFVVLVGILLVVGGFIATKKRQFEIGIGGRAATRPLITLTIKGIGAVIVGISCIATGTILLIYLSIIVVRQELYLLDFVFSSGAIVILVTLTFGFIIAIALQILMKLVATFGRDKR
ncbi:MAG: hypothetical protein JNJ61_04995 [Anaerolineae bacterium]|nr:hypothetical protein [Anaerolineae bacterium]